VPLQDKLNLSTLYGPYLALCKFSLYYSQRCRREMLSIVLLQPLSWP
jgi:hypothetical protein